MATTFKTLLNSDVTTTRTLLHEAIPITGTIASGTYRDSNIKNYSHGMFQSVYDYPFLSSSANHIFDITCGHHTSISGTVQGGVQVQKKYNLYNQMAQVLMGHDENGNVRQFDADGDLTGGTKINGAYFISFSRLLVKDEIKKGTFTASFYTGSTTTAGHHGEQEVPLAICDYGAATEYRINAAAGEYGLLYTASHNDKAVGLVFYQAGVAVLSSSVFSPREGHPTDAVEFGGLGDPANSRTNSGVGAHGVVALTGTTIQNNADGLRNRLNNIQFVNTTELNSTIYFCRANHNEFNYSANPSYITGSKLRVKNVSSEMPLSYITSVGLYSSDNELLATAKLSEPLRKDPTTELTLRVRLDY